MEIINFLKYGAIGIAMVLAIFSYRLLSQEQQKNVVRPEILKTIRQYFLLAVFLSVFFGVIELINAISKNDDSDVIEEIYSANFKNFNDSTIRQKKARIMSSLNKKLLETDTLNICSVFIKEGKDCSNQLDKFQNSGFLQNIVVLKYHLQQDPDGWTNLNNDTDAKGAIFDTLRKIFKSLGHNFEKRSNKELIKVWMSFKSKWSDDQLNYIFNSDIYHLVQYYIDKFENV